MGEEQQRSKLQASANRSRDDVNSTQRLTADSGLPLADVGVITVVISEAVIDGLGRNCDGMMLSGSKAGTAFFSKRCDGVVNKGDITTMVTNADGDRIQALATGSSASAGGGGDTNITNINNNFFLAD